VHPSPSAEIRGDGAGSYADFQAAIPTATQPATGLAGTPTPVPTPARLGGSKKLSYSSCHVEAPVLAITFDDGPSQKLTPQLLDILKARGIKATFYVLGKNATAYPDILKRMVAEGHEIGNHSFNHLAFPKIGAVKVAEEVNQTNAAIQQATGIRPTTLRPPYGATNPTITKRLNDEFGLTVAMWSVDPLDWKVRNAAHVTSEITKHAAPGAIILAHDIHPTTVEAMPATLDALLAKGYKFVTVSELIQLDRPQMAKGQTPTPATTPVYY
jgi:peptidoglycan/xylan/chitin deacetylase (PgdA/CDA1 family)